MNEQESHPPSAENPASAQHGWLAALVGICMAMAALSAQNTGIGRYWSAVGVCLLALLSAVGHRRIVAAQQRPQRAERPADAPPVQRWVRVGTAFCLVSAFAVVPVCLLPVFLVEFNEWPRVKSSDLEVVSPGDVLKVRLTLDGEPERPGVYEVSLTSATVANADSLVNLTPPRFVLLTRLVGVSMSDPSHGDWNSCRLEVAIPDDPQWAGQTARVRAYLRFVKADKQASDRVSDSATVVIPVAPQGAGRVTA